MILNFNVGDVSSLNPPYFRQRAVTYGEVLALLPNVLPACCSTLNMQTVYLSKTPINLHKHTRMHGVILKRKKSQKIPKIYLLASLITWPTAVFN
jgi:hypothetical protein